MKNKLLIFLLCGVMVLGMTGCGSKTSTTDTSKELNNYISNCTKENEEVHQCARNDHFQTYLKTYSDYRLLDVSNKEFTSKPKEANSMMSYGVSTDFICDYDYVLIYNEKTEQAFSVKVKCGENESIPTFDIATELK